MALVGCPECGAEISTKAATCPHCGASGKKGTSLSTWVIGFCFALIVISMVRTCARPTAKSVAAPPALAAASPLDKISLEYHAGTTASGTILRANFKIKNLNNFSVKDLDIKCSYFAPSGTKLGDNKKTIYEIFPAGKTRTIKDFNMGLIRSQADTANCSITGFKPV